MSLADGDVDEEVVVEEADDVNGVVVADGMLEDVEVTCATGVVEVEVVVDASELAGTVAGALTSVGVADVEELVEAAEEAGALTSRVGSSLEKLIRALVEAEASESLVMKEPSASWA